MKHYNSSLFLDNPVEHLVASLFFVAALAVLFPWGLSYSTTNVHITDDEIIDVEAAMNELRALMKRTDEPGYTPAVAHQVIKRAAYINKHTPWIRKAELDKAKALNDHSALRALEMKLVSVYRGWAQIAESREKFRGYPEQREELFMLEKNDAELQAIYDFKAKTTTYHWDVIGDNFRTKLPFSFALALIFFVGKIKARRLNLAVELMNPVSLLLATATFPVSWIVYPYKDPRQQISKVVNAMGMAFSLLMSLGGVANAQTVKKSEGKKKDDRQVTLQTDSRVMVTLGGDSPKEATLFNRATVNFGKGVIENISLATPTGNFWYSETCGGPWLPKTASASVLAIGCVTKGKDAKAGWATGIQVYRPFGKRFFLAVPVMRMEGKTFNFLAAVSAEINNRWSVAPEVNIKLTLGKLPSKTFGISLRRSLGKDSAEIAILRNGIGQQVLRPRLIQNFAF